MEASLDDTCTAHKTMSDFESYCVLLLKAKFWSYVTVPILCTG